MERRGEAYDSVRDLWLRSGLSSTVLERLADADAFRSLGLDRRQALWAVRGLDRVGDQDDLPLFASRPERDTEPDARLPPMPLGAHVVEDYRRLSLSLKAHPASFMRARLSARGILRSEALRSVKNGERVTVAGLVLVRQRPGTAAGVIFMTLEDETGVANIIVWPKIFERLRAIVLGARFVAVTGKLQSEQGVIHIVAERMNDLTSMLGLLSEAGPTIGALARADEAHRTEPTETRKRQGNRFAGPPRLDDPRAKPPSSADRDSGRRRSDARGAEFSLTSSAVPGTTEASAKSKRSARRFQRVREPHFRRPGFERLRLALMRRPGGEPHEIEGRAQAPVRIGEFLGVNSRCAQKHLPPQRLAAARVQRVRGPHSAQVGQQRENVRVADDHPIEIDDRQRQTSALRQSAERPHVNKGRDPRRRAAENLALGDGEALSQLGQRFAANHRRDQKAVGFQGAPHLHQRARQVVHCLERKQRDDEVKTTVPGWKALEVADGRRENRPFPGSPGSEQPESCNPPDRQPQARPRHAGQANRDPPQGRSAF